MFGGHFLTKAHQATNSGWSAVEDSGLIFLDNFPPAVGSGIGWNALVQNNGRGVHQRSVNDVAVSGDPTDVGGTPEDVIRLDIKDKLSSGVNAYGVAALDMDNAFGLAGATACIEDVERVFAI